MKPSLALLWIVPFSVGLLACGGAGKDTSAVFRSPSNTTTTGNTSTIAYGPTSGAAPSGYFKGDEDKDEDDIKGDTENDDGAYLKVYGGQADEADTQAVTTVVKRYLAAAAAEDGRVACSLLYSSLAFAVAGTHANAADRSAPPGGKTCATAMTQLFERQHGQLVADEVATMAVTTVRAHGGLGLAVLAFKKTPESQILVEREGGVWKIDALLDNLMP